MSFKQKLIEEVKIVLLTSLYFFLWFGSLMVIKNLLLREYHIEIVGVSIVIIGALIVAKAVLILEYIPIPFTKNKPAILEVLVRTFLYLMGVFVILVLEKSIEARNEYGGVGEALKNLWSGADIYHIWVNTICVFGALFFYNIWSVIKGHFGERIFIKLMRSPMEDHFQADSSQNMEDVTHTIPKS